MTHADEERYFRAEASAHLERAADLLARGHDQDAVEAMEACAGCLGRAHKAHRFSEIMSAVSR